MSTIAFTIDGLSFQAVLDPAAAVTAAALRRRLPIDDVMVHARWSGPMYLMRKLNLGVALENPVALLAPGDIVYHPTHFDIGISYDATQFIEMTGPVYVTRLGRLAGNLAALAALGETLQARGAIRATIAP